MSDIATAPHGTMRRYRQGCRCERCNAENAARRLLYKRTEGCHGAENCTCAGHRASRDAVRWTHVCSVCGERYACKLCALLRHDCGINGEKWPPCCYQCEPELGKVAAAAPCKFCRGLGRRPRWKSRGEGRPKRWRLEACHECRGTGLFQGGKS